MKLGTTLLTLAAGVLPLASAHTSTTQNTRMLRGKKVVHTRTIKTYAQEQVQNAQVLPKKKLRKEPEALVDPHPKPQHHHYVKLRGKTSSGGTRDIVLDLDKLEDKLPHDSRLFQQFHHDFHHEEARNAIPQQPVANVRGEPASSSSRPQQKNENQSTKHEEKPHIGGKLHHGHRSDHDIHHHDTQEHQFQGHAAVEQHEEHHYHHQHSQHNATPNLSTQQHENKAAFDWKRDRSMYTLPTGLNIHFNETLFDSLHDAPFRVYEEALGHKLEYGESFPIFALPKWLNTTGVFTGFSKTASPLIFENVQFLLHWHDTVAASSGASPELEDYITDHNFQASLIIGKSVGNGAKVAFVGMVVSYYQYGSEKNVLVPFSKLEDFFDDTSEKHLLDPKTKSLEMAALHDLLEEKRTNVTGSQFYHPALAHTEERKARLEDLEIVHFQKLFQLLIRRSFLFSFGYADCLLNKPHELRHCIDDTFYSLIKMETSVRGALDDQMVEQLVKINDGFHSKVSEACISVQGSSTGMMYGSGSCYDVNDLSAFVGTYTSVTL